MADIINLNKARKAKARKTAEQQAAANRLRHGRSKAQKLADRTVRLSAEKALDGHRLEPGQDD